MKRFDKELELLHACSHPSILKPFGVFRVPPTYALVLPHFERGSLFGLLHSKGIAFTPPTKLSISRDLTLAIAHMHERGLLHRDIKSDNVLVHGDGRIVLADFNAAEWETLVTSDIVMQARPTGGFFKQFVVGTLPYMAPELLRSVRGAAYARARRLFARYHHQRGSHAGRPVLGCNDRADRAAHHPRGEIQPRGPHRRDRFRRAPTGAAVGRGGIGRRTCRCD